MQHRRLPMSSGNTWIGYARSVTPRDEEERTVPDLVVATGEQRTSTARAAGEHLLTTDMLEQLRARLREAEALEESGVRLRPDLDNLDDDLDFDVNLDDGPWNAVDALDPLPELETALAPNSESNFYAGFDESHPDGVFLATYSRLAVGTPVYVTVLLPAGHRFRTPALVESIRPSEAAGPDAPAGIGLKMCGLDDEARRLVRVFARQRRPIFYVA